MSAGGAATLRPLRGYGRHGHCRRQQAEKGANMPHEAIFSSGYRDARKKFIGAAQRCGATLTEYLLPDKRGPEDESLTTDVATLGPRDAESALLILSGTHGLEGPAGSAIQTAFLEQLSGTDVPDGMRIVLIHAVNPWGFAWQSRTTEDNVDLNRNFLDFDSPLPENPGYRELHEIICRGDMTERAQVEVLSALDEYESRHGYRALSDALGRGQYEFPTGLSYGGREPAWSNRTLRAILDAELGMARRIGVIDWHTGRGEFGDAFYLCFSPVGSRAFERAADWWGYERLTAKDEIGEAYEGEAPPPRTGLLMNGMDAALPGQLAGAVIEIGTYEPRRVVRAEIIDRWLKFEAKREAPLASRLRQEMVEAFFPAAPQWRQAVIDNGLEAATKALEGVVRWHTDTP